MYRKTTLPSGIRVLTERMDSVRSVSLGIWADVGSSAERANWRGISHLVEHMVFKGTQRRSAREIAEAMDGVGGNLNAFTDKEVTCYYARVIDKHVPLALDVLSDMLQHPLLTADDIAKEQRVVVEEIKMYEDSPSEHIHDLFVQSMWAGSPLGDPTIGFENTVLALDSASLRQHLQDHYAPNALLVCAAGNVDHDEFVAQVQSQFDGYHGTSALPAPLAPIALPQTRIFEKDIEQAHVILGMQGLSVCDDRRYTLSVIDTLLGGGMSSRLFQEIREKRGLVYTVYSFQNGYRGSGLFGIYAGCSAKNVQPCIDVTLEQLELLRTQRVSDAELHLAKEHMKGSLTLSLESTSSRMMRLGRGEYAHERQISTEEIETAIDAVTVDAISELSQELFAQERLGMCVLGPVENVELFSHAA